MAIIEAWWGNTTWTDDLKFTDNPDGVWLYCEGGGRGSSVITWRHYVGPDRMPQDGLALSPPALMLKGRVPDVLTKLVFRLTQRIYVNDIPAGAGSIDYPIAITKLPNLAQLGPLAFPPLAFQARKGQQHRFETEVVVQRWFKGSRPYNPNPPPFDLGVPQWGVVLDLKIR
jgi:hypothetical protein